MFKSLSVLVLLVLSLNSYTQTVDDTGVDEVWVGKPGSTNNPKIKLLNGYVQKNISTGKLEFSHDGSNPKAMGTGSGSGGDAGVNILSNSSCEDPLVDGWSFSGDSFTSQNYSNAVEGDQKFCRFVASAAGQYFETTLKAVPDFGVGGCLAKINYKTSDSFNWKLQVFDSSSNLLKEENLYARNWQDAFAGFPCPSSGTQIKARVISLAAGQIDADRSYLGKENRTFESIKPIEVITISQSSSTFNAGTSDTVVPISTVTSSLGYTYPISSNSITIRESGSYSWRMKSNVVTNNENYVQKIYKNGSLLATGYTYTGDANASGSYSTYVDENQFTFNKGDIISFYVTNTSTRPVRGTQIVLTLLPSGSDTAIRPESQDWFVDVSIGGAGVALSTSSVTSYTEMTDGGLDMVINQGSAPAKIPCSATNASTGLTCSAGNESVGIVFTNPNPGFFEVCADFTYAIVNASGSAVNTAFQLIQTPNSAQSITQEGKGRTVGSSNATTVTTTFPFRTCGNFYFSDVSEKTIRLMYESSISGTPTSSIVSMDRAATVGQRDTHIVVRPLLSAYNRPYLVEPQNIAARCTRGLTGQSINNSSVVTLLCDVEDFDTANALNHTTGVFTAPNGGAGYYSVSGTCNYASTAYASGDYQLAVIQKNGANYLNGSIMYVGAGSTFGAVSQVNDVNILLQPGETVSIGCRNSKAAGSTTLSSGVSMSNFSIIRIKPL